VKDDDPLITVHICDVLLSIDKTKETILLLAGKIKEFPYLIPLLLKQAQAFIKYEYYEYALKLTQISVDLCPESFEGWLLLAESYFYMRRMKRVNIHPFYSIVLDKFGYRSPLRRSRAN